jgi:glycosyltransferase involved in cell wall biosynthesis
MKVNLLIITYYFPPLPGPGSRRWAKFVKYLSKNNNLSINVITAQSNIKIKNSSYNSDIENLDINLKYLPSNYPKYLERIDLKALNLWDKIMFRVQHFLIKRKAEGNYWDLSVFWDIYFEDTIPKVIKNNEITKIIISGPPYRYAAYALKLKNKFKNLEIILDYRDPWNDFNDPKQFEKTRIDFEKKIEKEVLKSVDKIITVSKTQKQLIESIQPHSAPVFVIPNGYDPDDCIKIEPQIQHSDKIKLTHFGTLHQQKDYYWKPFLNALIKLKKEKPNIYTSLEIDFVGYTPPEIENYIKKNDLSINIYGILPPETAYQYLSKTDIALWFKYDGSPHEFATKFGDYIALKKHIWTFSVEGDVTNHIQKNKIGTVFLRSDKQLTESIFNALKELKNNKPSFNEQYDSKHIQIPEISKKIINLLESS